MPVYTCTATTAAFNGQMKKDLAAEITHIRAEINHVPTTYVNVVFHEVPPENLYTDSVPAASLLINGWVRQGHPAKKATRLALEIAHASSRITGLPEKKVLVVIQSSPASAAVEGGRVLPEPGQEAAWIAEQQSDE
jgi:phenylpyruvate tautomerase PptA (4-oxalocrotonate tautomerase family)